MKKNYNLIQAREEVKLTQEQFASMINIDKTSYVYKENGKRKIWIHEVNKILKVLNKAAKDLGYEKSWTYEDIFLD